MMRVLLLSLFVVAVAAAPRDVKEPEIPVPDVAELPEPELPVIAPEPIVLPEAELPVVAPESIVLPEPELPVIVPEPIVLPEPVLPVVVPEPIILPEPVLPEIVMPEVIIPEPAPIVEDFQPQVPNGEVYNDGIVQVSVNAPEEAGIFSSLHSWVSMVINYISNGIQSSHQILG